MPDPISAVLGIGGKVIDVLRDTGVIPNKEAERAARLELERLAQAGELQEAENAVRTLEIAAADRASARGMQSATEDRTPRLIATGFIVGFFLCLVGTFFIHVPEASRPLLNVLLGALAGGVVQILNFYFGSSVGSKQKTEILSRSASFGSER